MFENSDLKHTNEFGDIEVLKDTRYWIKKDLQTIKKSFKSTLKYSPIILLTTILFSTLLTTIYGLGFKLLYIVIYTTATLPIFIFGFFLLHVLVSKGYDISAEITKVKTNQVSDDRK